MLRCSSQVGPSQRERRFSQEATLATLSIREGGGAVVGRSTAALFRATADVGWRCGRIGEAAGVNPSDRNSSSMGMLSGGAVVLMDVLLKVPTWYR